MPTKREYLIEKGLAGKRGRLSARAKEEVTRAINKGVRFSEPEDNRDAGIGETSAPRPDRPNGMYVFRNPDGTTFQRSEATACVTCSYSLQWCACPRGPVLFPYPHVRDEGARAILHKTPRAVITTKDVPEKQQPTQGTGRRRGRPRKG